MNKKQEVKSEKSVCQWPGCDNEALCRSGNFDDKLVCSDHFDLTNGSTVIDLVKQDDYWNDLEKAITQYNMEKLLIDGFEVSIILSNISKTELAYAVYVNGEIKGKWYRSDNPSIEAQKFGWKTTKRLFSKKDCKKLNIPDDEDNKIHFYHPYFKSFRTLKRSFKRNNESIKWLRKGKKPAAE